MNRSQDHGGENPAGLLEEPRPVRGPEPRLRWRHGFLASDALLLVLGAWLMVSPFVLPYGSGDGRWLPILCGAAIVALAVIPLAEIVSKQAVGWSVMAIAAVLFAGGLLLSDSIAASWNAAAGGALVAFLAVVAEASAVAEGQDGRTH